MTSGILLRPAEPADARAVAEVHVRAWQVGYRGLLPDEYLDALHPDDRVGRYRFDRTDPARIDSARTDPARTAPDRPATLLAVDGASVVGFATTGRSDEDHGVGELLALYVDPSRWGNGVGSALLGAARSALVERGFDEAVLWVLRGNQRAERVYRADRWRTDGAEREEEVWGLTVDEVRFRRALP